MKIIHISDLHFGKVIHGVSMLENGDQPDWTNKFLALTADIHPDAVVIAGDVYDRSSPSGEAVALLRERQLFTGKLFVLDESGEYREAAL